MKYISFIILSFFLISSLADDSCSVPTPQKIDCGYSGIDQKGCEAKGCCWMPVENDTPWCFYKSGHTCDVDFSGTDPGFTDDNVKTMYGYFMDNINIKDKGGVVASPDPDTPGGSYYWHWERDGALSMKAFMTVHDFNLDDIDENMQKYVTWVTTIQAEKDPNQIDIRVEVKYYLSDDQYYQPYDGGWCRPQCDGPGLRSITLILYSNVLLKSGKEDYVKEYIWTGDSGKYFGGTVKYDLDWVADNWQSNTCDLWEEIRSTDLFWNRITMRRALLMGSDFAKTMGDTASSQKYADVAKSIEDTLNSHYDKDAQFIREDQNRQKDAAVITSFNDGFNSDDIFKPTDPMIAGTIKAYNSLFCNSYQVNQDDTTAGIPGVLYGRYEGDSYAGGNPWILTSASLAELFYRGASSALDENELTHKVYEAWKDILSFKDKSVCSNYFTKEKEVRELGFFYRIFMFFFGRFFDHIDLTEDKNMCINSFAVAMGNAGDSVLYRIYNHVKNDGFHLAEQIDRNTGAQASAKDLTWSYGNVLTAMHARKTLMAKLE